MKTQIRKKRAISKTSIDDVISVNFQIAYNVLKIVKKKIRKLKLSFFLYIPPLYFNNTMALQQSQGQGDIQIQYSGSALLKIFYVNFPFPFQNKILLRIGNIHNRGTLFRIFLLDLKKLLKLEASFLQSPPKLFFRILRSVTQFLMITRN